MRLVIMTLTAALACSPAFAQEKSEVTEEWSQWRGPKRDGIATESGWLKKWPKVRMKPKWSRKIGNGYSAVSVWKGKLYTMGYVGGMDNVFCLDPKTGKTIWNFTYTCKIYDNMNAGGPSCTPSVVDGRVYTISREANLHCLDAKTGKVEWKLDLKSTHDASVPQWGFSGSPLVMDGKLYVDVGRILCFDAKTGKEKWRSNDFGSAYSSPIAFSHGGKEYLACFPEKGLLILERETGKRVALHLWKTNYGVNAATPVIMGDKIFISSGYNTGGALLQFDGSSLKELWKNKIMRNHMASSVYFKGHLYGFDDSRLRCINAETGASVWDQRGLGKGSLILADGKLVVLSERGELIVAEASHEGFKPAARRKILTASGCWTAPVLANDRIYCRSSAGELVSVDVKSK